MVAVSFVQNANDVKFVRTKMTEHFASKNWDKHLLPIISKIEVPEVSSSLSLFPFSSLLPSFSLSVTFSVSSLFSLSLLSLSLLSPPLTLSLSLLSPPLTLSHSLSSLSLLSLSSHSLSLTLSLLSPLSLSSLLLFLSHLCAFSNIF